MWERGFEGKKEGGRRGESSIGIYYVIKSLWKLRFFFLVGI